MHHRTLTRTLLLAVAALVLAACTGGGAGGTTDPATAKNTVTVVAGDMFFEPAELSIGAGSIAIELVNDGAIVHNLVIEQTGTKVVEAQGGASNTGTVTLEPGTYTFYCDIPGHRQAGMEGTLEVT